MCASRIKRLIKESAAHIECEIVNQHPYEGVTIFVGKVLHAEVEENFWDGKSIAVEKLKSMEFSKDRIFYEKYD